MTTVSVVIPCYNMAEYLAESIESVLAQTRPVTEIIVVDDGSTDGSPDVAARYPVGLLRTPANGGPFVARNVGIRAARGDVIASLDADDWWYPEHCARVVALLERYPEAVVAGSAVRFTGARDGIFAPRFVADGPVDVFWTALRAAPVPHMSAMVRKAALLGAGGYYEPDRAAGDFDLWLRLSRRAPFVCTHEVTAAYRWHPAQISAEPLKQLVAVYRSRQRMWRSLVADGDAAHADRLGREARAIWAEHLREAWQARDLDRLTTMVALGAEVPGGSRLLAWRWSALRRASGLLLAGWAAIPTGARGHLKRLLGWRRAEVRPPEPSASPWRPE